MASINAERIINYLKENYGKEFSKHQIAEALNVSLPTVTGTMNNLIKKGYAIVTRTEEREEPAAEGRKAKITKVLYHTLTEDGLSYDPVAEAAAKAAAKAE